MVLITNLWWIWEWFMSVYYCFSHINPKSSSGWWLTYPSEKYDFVSWDYEIPNMGKIIHSYPFMFQSTNQIYIYVPKIIHLCSHIYGYTPIG